MFITNIENQLPGLFGLKYSNRDFTQKEAWGKNCFNSSLPASLCAYLYSKNLESIYIKLNSSLRVEHSNLSTASFYGIEPNPDNLFYAFESQFTPYQRYLIGTLPGVDLVTQAKDTGTCLQAIEIKLTALPDNTTCNLSEDLYGCEIVVRPDTIVYLACSIAETFKLKQAYINRLEFNPEVIIGGPPCQDFSSAGKRDESLGRANLTLNFANIIVQVKPRWFVMENVERIAKSHILETVLAIFKDSGYGLTSSILNASYCGVPQVRKRYFLIGQLGEKDNFLSFYLSKNQAKKSMTVFEYLGDSLGVEYFYRHPRSYKRRAVFSIHEPSPTIRGVNRPIPKTYKKHRNRSRGLTKFN